MSILVTGAAGFVGRAIVRQLVAAGRAVVGADLAGAPSAGMPHVVLDLLDRAALDRLLGETRPGAVVHAAAVVGMPAAAREPSRAVAVNVLATQHLIDAMGRVGVPHLVHISTQDVYGHFTASVVDEDHPRQPVSLYGTTKLMAELLLEEACRSGGLGVTSLRPAWVYGPGMAPFKFPRSLLEMGRAEGRIVLPHGRESVVDLVHVEDLARLVDAAIDRPAQGFLALNAASGVAHPVAAVCREIAAGLGGVPVGLGPGRLRTGDGLEVPRQGALAMGRAREALGVAPAIGMAEGIARLVGQC